MVGDNGNRAERITGLVRSNSIQPEKPSASCAPLAQANPSDAFTALIAISRPDLRGPGRVV